jgi:hypothetical protein
MLFINISVLSLDCTFQLPISINSVGTSIEKDSKLRAAVVN